jgi:hypothetical protein
MTSLSRSALALLAAGAVVLLDSGCAGGKRSGSAEHVPTPVPVTAAESEPASPATPPGSPRDLSPEALASLQAGAPKLLEEGVLFTFVSRRARSVAVAGTFNGWVPNSQLLVRRQSSSGAPPAGGGMAAGGGEVPADSLWYALVPVSRGRHAYKYLVDGSRWLADPHNARQTSDGVGGVASVLVVP